MVGWDGRSRALCTQRAADAWPCILLAVGLAYSAETLNSLGNKHWKSFATQNYFDSRGVFASALFSAPLIFIAFVILVCAAHRFERAPPVRSMCALPCKKSTTSGVSQCAESVCDKSYPAPNILRVRNPPNCVTNPCRSRGSPPQVCRTRLGSAEFVCVALSCVCHVVAHGAVPERPAADQSQTRATDERPTESKRTRTGRF